MVITARWLVLSCQLPMSHSSGLGVATLGTALSTAARFAQPVVIRMIAAISSASRFMRIPPDCENRVSFAGKETLKQLGNQYAFAK